MSSDNTDRVIRDLAAKLDEWEPKYGVITFEEFLAQKKKILEEKGVVIDYWGDMRYPGEKFQRFPDTLEHKEGVDKILNKYPWLKKDERNNNVE